MDIRQCKRCGKLVQYTGRPMCFDCLDELDKMFLKVREHIYKNPNATIQEIAEKTEVEEKYILDFLKEERLSLTAANGVLQCEICKQSIATGRLCEECREKLKKVMPAETYAAPKSEPYQGRGARMHINKGTGRD